MKRKLSDDQIFHQCSPSRFPAVGRQQRPAAGRCEGVAMALAGVITVAGAVLPGSASEARDLYVNRNVTCSDTSSGGTSTLPYCTISYPATKIVVGGDTVHVAAGTYPERAKFSRSGTSTASTGLITFTTDGNSVTVGSGQDNGLYFSGVSFITANGFTVSGTNFQGVKVSLGKNITLNNIKVFNSLDRGIYVTSSSNVVIDNGEVANSKFYGIQATYSSNITISNTKVSYSGQPTETGYNKGIYIGGCTDSKLNNNTAFNNTDSGIYLTNATTNVTVEQNTAYGNDRGYTRAGPGIEIRGTTGNFLKRNITYANRDTGLQLYSGADNNTVINNLSFNNGDHGIDNLRSLNTKIYYNTIFNNVTAGINVEGYSTGADVRNNISVDNGIDSPRTEGNIRIENGSTQGTTVNYNLVYLTRGGASGPAKMYTYDSVEYYSLAQLRAANPSVEVNGLEANPLWVAPGLTPSADFHLTSTSPARNASDPALPVSDDLDGGSPRDAQPDRGAYEF